MEHPHIPCSLVFFQVQESHSPVVPLLLNLLFIIQSYLEIKTVEIQADTCLHLKICEGKGILSSGALKYGPWWQF